MNDSGIRAASIVATSAAKCLVVPGADFKALLGSLDGELAQRQGEYDEAITALSPRTDAARAALEPQAEPPPSDEEDTYGATASVSAWHHLLAALARAQAALFPSRAKVRSIALGTRDSAAAAGTRRR